MIPPRNPPSPLLRARWSVVALVNVERLVTPRSFPRSRMLNVVARSGGLRPTRSKLGARVPAAQPARRSAQISGTPAGLRRRSTLPPGAPPFEAWRRCPPERRHLPLRCWRNLHGLEVEVFPVVRHAASSPPTSGQTFVIHQSLPRAAKSPRKYEFLLHPPCLRRMKRLLLRMATCRGTRTSNGLRTAAARNSHR